MGHVGEEVEVADDGKLRRARRQWWRFPVGGGDHEEDGDEKEREEKG